MNITKIILTLAVFSILVIPAVSMATTYQYISTRGDILSLLASSPQVALATAPNLALHSGVKSVGVDGPIGDSKVVVNTPVNTSTTFYQYIDINGNVRSINASNATVALNTAPNLGVHSGVILVTDITKLTN